MVKVIKNSKGYVSIESMVISIIVLGICALAFMKVQKKENEIVDSSLYTLENVNQVAIINNP